MAQVFSAKRVGTFAHNKRLTGKGTFYCTKEVMLSCIGPATSVQAGMTLSVASWLPTHCYGGTVLGKTAGAMYDLDIEVVPTATTFAPSTVKILAKRLSTGDRLSSAVNLTGQKWVIKFLGD